MLYPKKNLWYSKMPTPKQILVNVINKLRKEEVPETPKQKLVNVINKLRKEANNMLFSVEPGDARLEVIKPIFTLNIEDINNAINHPVSGDEYMKEVLSILTDFAEFSQYKAEFSQYKDEFNSEKEAFNELNPLFQDNLEGGGKRRRKGKITKRKTTKRKRSTKRKSTKRKTTKRKTTKRKSRRR